jgi:hypothetical protein
LKVEKNQTFCSKYNMSIEKKNCTGEFLDDGQYSRNGILRYERIFGDTFVSTGGVETTKVKDIVLYCNSLLTQHVIHYINIMHNILKDHNHRNTELFKIKKILQIHKLININYSIVFQSINYVTYWNLLNQH